MLCLCHTTTPSCCVPKVSIDTQAAPASLWLETDVDQTFYIHCCATCLSSPAVHGWSAEWTCRSNPQTPCCLRLYLFTAHRLCCQQAGTFSSRPEYVQVPFYFFTQNSRVAKLLQIEHCCNLTVI